MADKLFKETECTVCDEAILASEPRFQIAIIRQPDGMSVEAEEVCESCMEEVRKALGYQIAKRDII